MNLLIKRRQLIMATLVVALGSAVFVNWYFTNSDANVVEESEKGSEYVQNIGEAKYVNSDNAKTETVPLKHASKQSPSSFKEVMCIVSPNRIPLAPCSFR